MTTVTFSKINNRIRVSAIDHAYGSDAVCNGISTMMYSLEAWLLNHPDCIKGHENEFRPGLAEIEFTAIESEVYDILGFVATGLLQIENTYGKQFIAVNISDELEALIR